MKTSATYEMLGTFDITFLLLKNCLLGRFSSQLIMIIWYTTATLKLTLLSKVHLAIEISLLAILHDLYKSPLLHSMRICMAIALSNKWSYLQTSNHHVLVVSATCN